MMLSSRRPCSLQGQHATAHHVPLANLQRSSPAECQQHLRSRLYSGSRSQQRLQRISHAARARRSERLIVCKSTDDSTHKVICFGEALFDCLADQKGVPVPEVKSWTPYPGGAPANVACALAQLGTEVVFVGNLGHDELGDQMAELLTSRGIDLSAVQRTPQPTRDVLVTRGMDGDRTFAGFGKAKANEYADCFIDASKLPEDVLQVADILVTGTLGLAYPVTAKAMQRAVELARNSSKCSVLVDVNWRPVFFDDEVAAKESIMSYVLEADVIKVTEDEAEWLFGIPGDDALEHPEKVLECMPKSKGVLVTAGADGSAYAFRGSGGKIDLTGRVPVLKVDVLDTTGAGDGFLGGFLHYTVKKGGFNSLVTDAEALRKAVEFGTACGAYVTQGPGAIAPQPTEADVAKFLLNGWDFEIPPPEYFELKL